ncbi:hypothetical protein B0H34DRAFT_674311 [Crassisporium funariophilum]|nr:hypothetical protein B0H34DRAFT_674311 [Crassisporium funariophilum]
MDKLIAPFLASVLSVRVNAVKNILFQAAKIAFEFFLLRLFCFAAYKIEDYTSFLMFSEDVAQKMFFAISRKFNRQGLLVLFFVVLSTALGSYDTLLWALDFPGYVVRSTLVDASSLSSHMVDSPAYITFLTNPLQDLDRIELDQAMGANLYRTGLDFTLPGIFERGSREIVPANQSLSAHVSPRIWLDQEGFGVGVDDAIMVTPSMDITTYCSLRTIDDRTQVWKCDIQNPDSLFLMRQPMGRPMVWWDTRQSELLLPERKDNAWVSFGSGGGTTMMKQVFTVTKGHRRHTFMETTFKATMISTFPVPFANDEVVDFVRRTWSRDTGQPLTPTIQALADLVTSSQRNQSSLTFGQFFQDDYTVTSSSTELLMVLPAGTSNETLPLYAALRSVATNITLVRSENLLKEPTPLEPCNSFHTNIATGGIVHNTNCYKSVGDQSRARFLGQLDASSVMILNDILGDGNSNISARCLNQTGLNWYKDNVERIDRLLLSRGLILGGDRTTVLVAVNRHEAALSYLQLSLTLLPFGLLLSIFLWTIREPMSYYQSSFMAAVLATMHVSTDKCAKVGYIRSPPEIVLKRWGEHVHIGIGQNSTIAMDLHKQVIGLSNGHEPLETERFIHKQSTGADELVFSPDIHQNRR